MSDVNMINESPMLAAEERTMNHHKMTRQSDLNRGLHRLLVTSFALLCVATSDAGAGRRPNILFIMADDHTTQAVGAYGSRLAKLNPTPNIDALAKDGMRFDRVFCNRSETGFV
jgi:hypothetical protein